MQSLQISGSQLRFPDRATQCVFGSSRSLSTSGGFHDYFPRISSRRSVHQKESFVRSFVRSVVFPVAVNHSVSHSFVRSFVQSCFR